MQPSLSLREVLRVAETLLVAGIGGVTFSLVRLPGGLVSGSMLAVALAALMGRPMKVPLMLARVCFVLVGVLLGAVVTPETLHAIATWPVSVALLVLSAICMFIVTTCYLRLVHKWDPLSALLGASPGSMAQVLALSAEFGADLRGIAIVQVMRVLLIVLGLPAALALFGSVVGPTTATAATEPSAVETILLLAASAGASIFAHRIRFPGGLMFGAMAGSGLLHGSGLVHVSLPSWASGIAVLTLGAVAGARFVNLSGRMLLGYLGAALGSFAVAAGVAALFALLVTSLLPLRVADVALAFAPGAQDTMMVLALAMHLDPVYVGAHHLVRFLVVSVSVVWVARRVAKQPTQQNPKRSPD
jgi:uncharacterized protein